MKTSSIIVYLISLMLSYIGGPMILAMLYESGTVSLNYKDEKIPISMGLLFLFVQSFIVASTYIFLKIEIKYIVHYLLAFVLMGITGLLDDLIGDEKIKGFKGHIKQFFEGQLTTGALKAGIGFFSALFISIIISRSFLEVIINTLIIALFTNLINLFDLRPGRAIKTFIVFAIIMLFTSRLPEYNFILFSLFGILTIYFPWDLKAKSMMGDIGSNALGITLGIYCVFTNTLKAKVVYLLFLIIAHIVSEKLSYSKIIKNNRILNYLDKLGR